MSWNERAKHLATAVQAQSPTAVAELTAALELAEYEGLGQVHRVLQRQIMSMQLECSRVGKRDKPDWEG